jgi:hydrogenase expression/formation protein HypD
MRRVLEPVDSRWRGLGEIALSGLGIRSDFSAWDAARRYRVDLPPAVEPAGCCCGDVLRGVLDPARCPLFGGGCSPAQPQGACMVSSEGACAASYHYSTGEER